MTEEDEGFWGHFAGCRDSQRGGSQQMVSKELSRSACDHRLTKKFWFRKTVLYVENLDEQNVDTS